MMFKEVLFDDFDSMLLPNSLNFSAVCFVLRVTMQNTARKSAFLKRGPKIWTSWSSGLRNKIAIVLLFKVLSIRMKLK